MSNYFYNNSTNPALDFKDVLLVPSGAQLRPCSFVPMHTEVRSRSDVTLQVEYEFCNSNATYTGVPIIASNMDNIGTFRVHNVFEKYNMAVALTKTTSLNSWKMNFSRQLTVNNNTAMVSIGVHDSELDLLAAIMKETPVKFICMDIANGYLPMFARQIRKVRSLYPDAIIIAGNVVTPEAIKDLKNAGADCVKLGIGSGAACSTRLVAGTGIPQLTALLDCAEAANFHSVHIVSDGGCTNPGDFAKAFVLSSFVMAGGFFAGYNETGTEFYGMSSKAAMDKHHGGVAKHRSSEGHVFNFAETKGPLSAQIDHLLGGLRSALTYQNVNNLYDFKTKAKFVRVNQQNNTMFFK